MGQTDRYKTIEPPAEAPFGGGALIAPPGAFDSGYAGEDADVIAPSQTPDTPGNDENGDGLTGGQTTADNLGDVLGV